MIRTIILFLIIFGVVVISHEFGHFLIGRRNGIRVLEFMVGMGPTLFSFEKGGVKYSLKLFPIGGACLFDGEDGMAVQEEEKEENDIRRKAMMGAEVPLPCDEPWPEEEAHGIPFTEAGVWRRIATIFAGPFFNFILAFIVALVLTAFYGIDRPVIEGISENSAAEEAGLKAGDEITRINNERIHFYREISVISSMNRGETLEIHYTRDGQKGVVTLEPRYDEEDGRYYIGFIGAGEYEAGTPLRVFQYSFYEVEYYAKTTYKSLGMLIHGRLSRDDVSGPVGIAHMVGTSYDTVEKKYGTLSAIMTMLEIVVLLSVNLGIMNLLPLPALDGGRLLFLFVEVVRGKPVAPEKEGLVHFAGLVVFMILTVFVMYNDIMKIVH